jgi:transcriptional regulator with XRE-family HTH domain
MPCDSIMDPSLCVIGAVHFSKRVGLIVRQLRLERGWSQQQLADRMNYERSRIGRLELGQTAITVDILLVIANALQVDIHSLLPVEVRLKREVCSEQWITAPHPLECDAAMPSPCSPAALP